MNTTTVNDFRHFGRSTPVQWLAIVVATYTLLLAVGMIGTGFKWAAGPSATELFEFASNPLVALMVGMVATALIQSSSTVTSIIVGLVAGGMPVEVAIPMVMGANIGTTVTNTIVSLAHLHEKDAFKRAFSAATIHDFFNLLAVAIFLPLELMFGLLEKSSAWFASLLVGGESMSLKGLNFVKPLTKPVSNEIKHLLDVLPEPFSGIVMILVGIVAVFVAVLLLGKLLRSLLAGRANNILEHAIGRGPVRAIAAGTGVTVMVQSSSTTTSLMIPLAGSGLISLKQLYPFTLGSNIGTTITALLAATAITSGDAFLALQIAVIHFFFNLFAVLLIYGVPFLRDIPLRASLWLSDLASRQKGLALAYILLVFFIVPLTMIGATEVIQKASLL
jgi:sodium-dependent phosphate cotransporter